MVLYLTSFLESLFTKTSKGKIVTDILAWNEIEDLSLQQIRIQNI